MLEIAGGRGNDAATDLGNSAASSDQCSGNIAVRAPRTRKTGRKKMRKRGGKRRGRHKISKASSPQPARHKARLLLQCLEPAASSGYWT